MTTPVSFPIAKLLKEKGFDEPARQRYFIAENIDSDRFPFLQEECALHNWNNYDDSSTTYYSAPTIAEVVMWLYEKHGTWISVFEYKDYAADVNDDYVFRTSHTKLKEFNSPTKAYEAAIEYVLKNLIQEEEQETKVVNLQDKERQRIYEKILNRKME